MGASAVQDVAIIVPQHTLSLDADERISFRHLRRFLGGYDTYLVLPEGLKGTLDDLPVRHFDPRSSRATALTSA